MRNAPTRHLTESEAWSLGRPWALNFKRELKKFKKCGLYIVEFDWGIKVGISNNVQKRIETYLKGFGEPKQVLMYATPQPRRLELKLISKFAPSAFDNKKEFFIGVPIKDIISYLEKDKYFKR